MKAYTIVQAVKDIIEFEGLVPVLNIDERKNESYLYKYSEYYLNPLNSNLGYKVFVKRCKRYFLRVERFNIVDRLILSTRKKIINILRSNKTKKTLSIVLRKRIKVKDENWTV